MEQTENVLFPVVLILICTLVVSVGYLIIKFRTQAKRHVRIINALQEQGSKVRTEDFEYIKKLETLLEEKNHDRKPSEYEGRWQDPNHPIISGEGGKGWQDPNHPIMR